MYQQPREEHSPARMVQALRTAFFSTVLQALYHEAGWHSPQKGIQLHLAAAAAAMQSQAEPSREVAAAQDLADEPSVAAMITADAQQLATRSAQRSSLALFAARKIAPTLVKQLEREAALFVALTEQPIGKNFLNQTAEPYKALLQMLWAQRTRFPLLMSKSAYALEAVSHPVDCVLSAEVLLWLQQQLLPPTSCAKL